MTGYERLSQESEPSVEQRIDRLDEAARLLAPVRPDLAEACEFAASLLREETEPLTNADEPLPVWL
jgi:hypothetical protein